MTRRAVFAFTVLADFVTLTVFFKALGIIQVLHLNAAQIGMRCGDKKARLFDVLNSALVQTAGSGPL
jgi:hypothetical protein